MNESELKVMLQGLLNQHITVDQAIIELKNTLLRNTTLHYANLDHHRELRHGLNEVIYGENKTAEQIIHIASHLAEHNRPVLISRLDAEKTAVLKNAFQEARINEIAGTVMIHPPAVVPVDTDKKFIAIVSAGTSDMRVSEEAFEVCVAMKIPTQRIYDVGVSGLHRIIASLDSLQKASAVIVIAGMEGALPSVVGGLIGAPIIAVPTSIGYGASFKGMAALLGMLNSCASGVVVTNIDAGFSAGFAAARIFRVNKDENTLS